jgi:hypothetical protein
VTKVHIANSEHSVRLDCEGTGNAVVKLAVQLWHETHCQKLESTTAAGQTTNWLLCRDADTGE